MSYWPTHDTDTQICVWCGGPSAGRWCSIACHRAEDGTRPTPLSPDSVRTSLAPLRLIRDGDLLRFIPPRVRP